MNAEYEIVAMDIKYDKCDSLMKIYIQIVFSRFIHHARLAGSIV